jgi:formylglycine-generating enzyme required for sulfatase activity
MLKVLKTMTTGLLAVALLLSAPVWAADGGKFGSIKPTQHSTQHSRQRFALVMGVGDYTHLKALTRTPADARAMARTFREMGFTVVGPRKRDGEPWIDPTRAEMALAIGQLSQRVEDYIRKNKGLRPQVAVFFSGHGMEFDRENYLLPKDVNLETGEAELQKLDMDGRAVSLGSMLDSLRKAGPHLTLVILDACRSLPDDGAKGPNDQGLTDPSRQKGEFVMYAAGEKKIAREFIGSGERDTSQYSVYTRFLLKEIKRNQPLAMVAVNVRAQVEKATGGIQSPAYYDSYSGSGQLVLATGGLIEQDDSGSTDQGSAQGGDPPEPPVDVLPPDRSVACALCPEMVEIPTNTVFSMGDAHGDMSQYEKPVRTVRMVSRFELGKYEVTVGEFKRFVVATGYRTEAEKGGSCWGLNASGGWEDIKGRHWLNPGFEQDDRHPVVCVSWSDAVSYIEWLNGQTKRSYRLASEAEFEYALRAGGRTKWPWGDDASGACRHGNVTDRTAANWYNWSGHECEDGFVHTAPVGRFQASAFGLHDMSGNVREWVQDCYEDGYDKGQASDGRAHEPSTKCARRVNRGGGWNDNLGWTRSANRFFGGAPGDRGNYLGFRLSRTLP